MPALLKFLSLKAKMRIARAAAIIILATDEHGETRINIEEFNKLKIKQKGKFPPVPFFFLDTHQ